ncbi:MAG: hypothetical protein HKP37_02140, partial [Boseongicola sp.]|nr:hypothetical protein [Boseongicola sp.]
MQGMNMGLEHAIEKLDKYFKRLEKGKARKIKPDHVEKVLRKLEARERELQNDLENTQKTDKKRRLTKKLELVREQKRR